MKKTVLKIVALLVLVLFVTLALAACGKEKGSVPASEGLAFITNGDGTCTLTGPGICMDREIVIPAKAPNGDRVTAIAKEAFKNSLITGIVIPDSVTSIGERAFYGCKGLTSVTIGSGVTSIGSYAFYNCSVTSVTIPNSVTSIGERAFSYCSGLTSITIGNGVTSIGDYAFYGCSGLTNITVENGNPVYHSAGNCLVETASKTLILGCKTSAIPTDGSVTSIGNGAFSECSKLTSVTIPDSVTSIGVYAFSGCSGLTSITIPDSVTSIGNGAFSDCSGLTSVTFQNSSGWYITQTEGASSGTNVTVTNASINATILKSTYCDYYWYRK